MVIPVGKFQLFSLGLTLLAICVSASACGSNRQDIKTDAFSSAGGRTSSQNFENYFIAGQPSPSDLIESNNFKEKGGFLAFRAIGFTVSD